MVEGFALGLATGPYCLAACAPFLVPYLCAEGHPGLAANLAVLARFLAGRLAAYILFGAAAGAAGRAVGPVLPGWLPGLALGLTALLMLAYALAKNFPKLSLCLAVSRWATPERVPFTLGFLTGINVCPPFVTGLLRALSLGSALGGGAFFASFFVSTSLYLLPVLGVWPWLSSERAQDIGRMALLLAGIWYLAQASAAFLR